MSSNMNNRQKHLAFKLIGQRRKNMCKRKRKFTKEEAEINGKRCGQGWYKCELCGGYHNTSNYQGEAKGSE